MPFLYCRRRYEILYTRPRLLHPRKNSRHHRRRCRPTYGALQLSQVKTVWREIPNKNASGPSRSFHFHLPAAPRYRVVVVFKSIVNTSRVYNIWIFPTTRHRSDTKIIIPSLRYLYRQQIVCVVVCGGRYRCASPVVSSSQTLVRYNTTIRN